MIFRTVVFVAALGAAAARPMVTLVTDDEADEGAGSGGFARPWEVTEDCLRLSYEWLSPPCRRALDEADGLVRPRPPCLMPFAVLTLAWALIALAVVKMQKRRRRRASQRIFDALHADPDLRTRVEKAAGVPIPAGGGQQAKVTKGGGWRCVALNCLALLAGIALTLLFGPALTLLAAAALVLAKATKIAARKMETDVVAVADVEEAPVVVANDGDGDDNDGYEPPAHVILTSSSSCGTDAVLRTNGSTNTAPVPKAQTSTNTEHVTRVHAATQDPPSYSLLV